MKKFVYIFIVLIASAFISCNKEEFEMSPAQELDNRALLMAQETPAIEKFQEFISSSEVKTKSAIIGEDPAVVNIFPLDGRTIVFANGKATKYFLYNEQNIYNNVTKEFTIAQTFPMKDGVVDLTKPAFEEKFIGCPFKKAYNLKDGDNIVEITYHGRFNNGLQYSYRGNNNSGRVYLAPLADCVWQLSVSYNDGDVWQSYATEYIDYYNQSINEIQLRFEVKPVTSLSYIRVAKELLKGAVTIEITGENVKTGEIESVWQEFMYDENLPVSVVFSSTFSDVRTIRIYTRESAITYRVKLAPYVVGSTGPMWYTL